MGAVVFFWQAHTTSRNSALAQPCHQGCLLSAALCSDAELLCASATQSPGSRYIPSLATSCTGYCMPHFCTPHSVNRHDHSPGVSLSIVVYMVTIVEKISLEGWKKRFGHGRKEQHPAR